MRVNEKTVELNFCAQVPTAIPHRVIWFGLTQKAERKLGFDTCARLNGSLSFFQFKASNWTLKNGARRFQADDHQLTALRSLTGYRQRSVFYAFPLIGDVTELVAARGDFLSTTWLVDVCRLGGVAAPTRRDGKPRASGRHHVDVWPGRAVFHSKAHEVEAINAQQFFEQGLPGSDGVETVDADEQSVEARDRPNLERIARLLGRSAAGLIVLRR